MTESERKPTKGPFPPVPTSGAPAGANETERMEEGELAATIQSGKAQEVPAPKVDQDFDNLDSTIVNVKIQQISGLKLVKELGRGAAGVVYLGKQEFLDRQVAVKMLLEQRKNPEYSARFKREAKLLAGLQHPHIVSCYQADVTPEGLCFLVMEFVDGPNLREYLVENGPLDVLDALRVCRDLAAALNCAHEKNIIHRDVKSENVLLASEPRASASAKFRYRAKLSDLGLARPQEKRVEGGTSLHLTVGATIMGTPLNMSPEQFDDPQGVDHRTDIYSLGCVLYDMLTAKAPFKERTLSTLVVAKHNAVRGPNPRAERDGIDDDVADLVMGMIAAKREDRPQTYAELLATCESLIEKLGGGRAKAPARSSASRFAALAAVTLLAGAGIWWALTHGSGEQQLPPVEFALRIEPVADAREGKEIRLTAVASGMDGTLSELEWKQLDTGHAVNLKSVGQTASFTAPFAMEPYPLTFIVSGRVKEQTGEKSAESMPVTVEVQAVDDPPAITIDGATRVKENELVTLTAKVSDPDEHGEFEYAWSRISGASVKLQSNGNQVSFTAPEAAGKYEVGIGLELSAGARHWSAPPVKIEVDAVNNPPVVKLTAPKSVEAGEAVSIDADVVDPDSASELKFEWRVESPPGIALAFDAVNSRNTRFIAPENRAGDYELSLALLTTDAGAERLKQTVALHVKCDPNLNALSAGERVSWMSTIVADALAGWSRGEPPPQLEESPDHDGFVLKCPGAEMGITRELRRGKFVLSLKLQPQSLKTVNCGVRVTDGDQRAVCVSFLPKEGEQRGLVSYATSKLDGLWLMPGAEAITALDTWESYKSLEIEIAWDGTLLQARWRDPAGSNWSAFVPLALPTRPRAVELFVNRGTMLVNDVAIRGM